MTVEKGEEETDLAWAVRVSNEHNIYLYHSTSLLRYLMMKVMGLRSDAPKNYDFHVNCLFFSVDKRLCKGWGGKFFPMVIRVLSAELRSKGLIIEADPSIEKAINHREEVGECQEECVMLQRSEADSCDLPYVMVHDPNYATFILSSTEVYKVKRSELR